MKVGSILLFADKGFLPDQIRLHMKILGRQKGKDYALKYNHAEIVVMHKGRVMSMGARGHGCEMSPVNDYLAKHPDYAVLEPRKTLTLEECRTLENYAVDICVTNKRKYQYGNFLAWISYIKTWGRGGVIRKGDKRLYCYELAARCAALVNRWGGESLDWVSIYDLWENPNYKH